MFQDINLNVELSEIYIGTSPKTALFLFKDKLLAIIKAILLEKKGILIYDFHF